MSITNLLIKLKPEEIPDCMKGKFFELHQQTTLHIDEYDTYDDYEYAGWVQIKEDGTIEFGEPGV